MLAMADGLDCNCSGASAPFGNFPSGNTYGNSRGGLIPYGMGGQLPGFGGNSGSSARFPYSSYIQGPIFGGLRH